MTFTEPFAEEEEAAEQAAEPFGSPVRPVEAPKRPSRSHRPSSDQKTREAENAERAKRYLARRVAHRAVAVAGLSERLREVLAVLCGAGSSDPVALTLASLEAGRKERSLLTSLHDIATVSDDMEAAVAAAEVAEDRSAWRQLCLVANAAFPHIGLSQPPSGGPARAGMACARALRQVERSEVEAVVALAELIG